MSQAIKAEVRHLYYKNKQTNKQKKHPPLSGFTLQSDTILKKIRSLSHIVPNMYWIALYPISVLVDQEYHLAYFITTSEKDKINLHWAFLFSSLYVLRYVSL